MGRLSGIFLSHRLEYILNRRPSAYDNGSIEKSRVSVSGVRLGGTEKVDKFLSGFSLRSTPL